MSAGEQERAEELSALSHALKTPLAVITGFAELLGARDDDRTRLEAAKRITEASEQLSARLDELLAAAQADADLAKRLLAAVASEEPA